MSEPSPRLAASPSPPTGACSKAGLRERVRRRATLLLAVLPGASPRDLGGFWVNAWPFPAVVFSAFLIAWGAECAQFLVSQGMALAILAWLQALPEFAVEAVIAWSQQVHFMTANFTGSLRLLVGLGWPLIFAIAAFGSWRRDGKLLRRIHLEDEHCVEVIALGVPITYFILIYFKGTLTLLDAAVLGAMYALYLWVLQKVPPREMESVEDLEAIPRAVMRLPRGPRVAIVLTFFLAGGAILYLSAAPFLRSMLRFAVYLGISEYLFIQWVAPFLSEFPEMFSTFYWARHRSKAPMALMNMVSANINQWTMLAAMIPIVYSFSIGAPSSIHFDAFQRQEILLTIAQSMLGMLLLANMSFHLFEAGGILFLWGLQFLQPHLHDQVTLAYFGWVLYELVMIFVVRRRFEAGVAFSRLWKSHGARAARKKTAPAAGA
jgi:cation:H+ antiporter